MKVSKQPIYNYTRNKSEFQYTSKVAFTSTQAYYVDGLRTISHNTKMFREDLKWDELIEIINNNFISKKFVNIYDLACSDTSESLTFAIKLIERFGEHKSAKYFPIKASDKRIQIIQKAGNNNFKLSEGDLERFKIFDINPFKYFTKQETKENVQKCKKLTKTDKDNKIETYIINDILKNKIELSHINLTDKLKTINDDSNTIIFCRNVFPYLSSYEIDEATHLLITKLKHNSFVALGQYDKYSSLPDSLRAAGFKEISDNIFQKHLSYNV